MCHVMGESCLWLTAHGSIEGVLGARVGLPWMGTLKAILVLCALIPRSTGRKTALVWTKQLIYLFQSVVRRFCYKSCFGLNQYPENVLRVIT